MRRIIRLAVVAILSAGAWVVVTNLMVAMNRSHQKRAMADIRAVATAWEARVEDKKSYWDLHTIPKGKAPAQLRVMPAELESVLAPTYIRTLPHKDADGSEYQFSVSGFDESGHAGSYTIRALGSDRRADRIAARGATTTFADDIVYSDGSFIQYPEGAS